MDAIILVGGQGTRLRPLTRTRHKSLVPLCNRPAIEYLFEWVRGAGFERAVLAIGQHNEDLSMAYPAGDYGGLQLVQVHEAERLESGGAIRNAVQEARIEGRFAVLNGDIFVEFDFERALGAHTDAGADLTLALHPVADPSQFGVAVVDARNMITGFVEKPAAGTAPGNLVNAGVWIFEPGLVGAIPPGAVRVEETLFPSLVQSGRPVLGYQFEGLWADIGTRERYLAINTAIAARGGGVAQGATVHPSATIEASSVGRGSTIAMGARLFGSLLWEDVIVSEGASLTRSIAGDHVVVGSHAHLVDCTIGSGCSIAPGVVLRPGTALEPGTRYDGTDER